MRPDRQIIGVVGAGVVGGALASWLEDKRHDVRVYDPPRGFDAVNALDDAETVYICVPTPYTPGVGFDDRHLLDAMSSIPGDKRVVIKSTVLPGTTDLLQSRYPRHRLLFNPEFLREATAVQDFLRPDRQIVGRASRADDVDARIVMAMLPPAPFERICGAAEAEMAKYVANSFLAVKVSFANEIFDLCERMRIDYADVRDIAGADERIGSSHMDVLEGGYRGYGGKCLPKDTKSLLDLARSLHVDLRVLSAADEVNADLLPASLATPLRLSVMADASESTAPSRGQAA